MYVGEHGLMQAHVLKTELARHKATVLQKLGSYISFMLSQGQGNLMKHKVH